MARNATTDLFHSFRFWAKSAGGGTGLQVNGADAGFSAITTPNYTVEAVEYRDGNSTFTKKYPGLPTTEDLTFSRGVVLRDTGFYDWLIRGVASSNDYREDILLYHFHRKALPTWNSGDPVLTQVPVSAIQGSYRIYKIFEAFATGVKPAADLDANTADVSVAEGTITYEHFDIEDVGEGPTQT